MTLTVTEATRVVRAALWRYLSSIVSYIFGFAYWTLACKLINPNAMGYYAAITAIVGLAGVLTSFSIGTGVLRYAGEAYGKGDLERCSIYFSTALTFRLLIALACSALLAALGILGVTLGEYRPIHFLLASMLCIPAMLGEVTYALLASTLRLRYYFQAALLGNIVRLVSLVALAILGHSLLALIGSYFLYSITLIVYPTLALVSSIRIRLRFRLALRELRELIDVGLVSWIPGLLVVLMNRFGIIFLFSVKGAFETGVYYVALTIASLLLGVVSNIQGFMLPYLAGLESDRERQMWYAHRLSLAIAVPLVASVVPFSDRLLALLKPEYAQGWIILALVALLGLLTLNVQPISNLLYVYNKHRIILKVALVSVLIRAALYIMLVPRLGAVGLPLTDVLSASITLSLYYLYVNGRYVKYSVERSLLIKILVIGIVVFTIGWTVRILVDNILLALPELAIGYLLTLRWRLISRSDLSFLGRSLLPYKIRQRISPIVVRILDIVYG